MEEEEQQRTGAPPITQPEDRMFLEKAARAVAEVQPHISTVADALVFLEVLGYTDKMARENGFADMFDLAKKVHMLVGHYDVDTEVSLPSKNDLFAVSIPGASRRVAEAFAIGFPSILSWAVLLSFGVSLWLAAGLPLGVTTGFLIGVFIALAITSSLRSFSRLFTYYDGQGNLSETKRLLKRYYGLLAFAVALTSFGVYSAAILENIPTTLALVAVFSTITLSIQLASYMVIYSKKEMRQVFVSYVTAVVVLLTVYILSGSFVSSPTVRYFYALGSSFVVLTVPAIYYHYSILKTKKRRTAPPSSLSSKTPHFFSGASHIEHTIPSRFEIQLWELLPYGVYGLFFIGMLFTDRVLSWIFNPVHLVNGISLPLVFNATYHIGADLALVVLFPALLIQYVILTPIFDQIYNFSLDHKVWQTDQVDGFLRARYRKMLVATLLSSAIACLVMITLGQLLLPILRGPSLEIFYVASVSNVLVSLFGGNALFLMFINKIKPLCAIAIACTVFVAAAGAALAYYGGNFEYIVFAYLGEAMIAVFSSSIVLRRNLDRAGSIHFARYV